MFPRQVRQRPAHPLRGAHGFQLPIDGGQRLGLLLPAKGQECLQIEPPVGGQRKGPAIGQIKRHRSPSRSR
ncbi:hypothetical protein D3C79_953940 [compost metagenome]